MGDKYYITFAKWPFKGYYEDCYSCDTLDEAVAKIKEYQSKGYNIIDLQIRDIDTFELVPKSENVEVTSD